MKKLFLGILLSALALACDEAQTAYIEYSEFPLDANSWTITGMVGPKWMQELVRTSWTVEGTPLRADFYLTESSIRIVFPGGGYRDVNYTMDRSTGTLSFDKPLFYATPEFEEDGFGEDILSCKYQFQTIHNMKFGGVNIDQMRSFALFDSSASSPDVVSLENRKWRCYLGEASAPLLEPLYPLDGPFGYKSNGTSFGDGLPIMSLNPIREGRLFPREADIDLSTIYAGPVWRHPSAAEAGQIVSRGTARYARLQDESERLYLEFPSGSQMILKLDASSDAAGFWIQDGKAVVLRANRTARTASVAIEEPAADALYCLWPVKQYQE